MFMILGIYSIQRYASVLNSRVYFYLLLLYFVTLLFTMWTIFQYQFNQVWMWWGNCQTSFLCFWCVFCVCFYDVFNIMIECVSCQLFISFANFADIGNAVVNSHTNNLCTFLVMDFILSSLKLASYQSIVWWNNISYRYIDLYHFILMALITNMKLQ